jgi:hypothetical protein
MPAALRTVGGNQEVLGWLSLPSGATTDDPVNHIIVSGNFPTGGGASVPIWSTDHSPQLYGDGAATFSTSIGRWLPVGPPQVAPDGQHYVYLHPDGTIRLAAADQSEAIVANPNKLAPIAYTAGGVVLVQNDIASNGLWLLDPSTHSITQMTAPAGNDDWREVGGTMAWGLDSPGVLGYPAPTRVLEASIASPGPAVTTYTAPIGDSIALFASDRLGGLLVALKGTTPGLVYVGPAGTSAPVAVPSGVAIASLGPRHYADAHGIWFIGQSGIFLFSPPAGFQSIAPGETSDIVPAGDCV